MTAELELMTEKKVSVNQFDHALIVMHNQLARKQTKWNVRETKLFLTALSQIRWRNEENCVCLKKADVIDALEMDIRDTNKLRRLFEQVAKKSWIKFDGPTDEEWDDGFLITHIRSTRKEIFVEFNRVYLPLLDQLDKQFTMYHLENVAGFKSKYAIVLYQDLKSRYNPKGMINHWRYTLNELKILFNLKPNAYMVKRNQNPAFDTYSFKKKVLDKAVSEINKDVTISRMHIDNVEVIKHHGMVAGYDIAFSLINADGTRYCADDEQLSLF